GIAHTRWATHGEPTERNAHPQVDASGRIAVVHNGIIENYKALKRGLEEKGVSFSSDTDTEVIAQLIGYEVTRDGKDLFSAVRAALGRVRGAYGIAVLSADEPGKIVAARFGSPLVLGIGDGEHIVASDVAAIVSHTRDVIYLDEGEVLSLSREGIASNNGRSILRDRIEKVEWELAEIEKEGYPHFMLKEIFSQPESLRNAFRGRIDLDEGTAHLGGLGLTPEDMRGIERIVITACGTSWHAALIGKYLIESLARIPVDVEYASEFRYRDPVLSPGTILLVISQSGETADSLAALRLARSRGCKAYGIVNVVGSTIARETDAGVYIHAGPEIGVASTKAFTSQVMVLTLIAMAFGRSMGHMSRNEGVSLAREIHQIPSKVQRILDGSDQIAEIAREFTYARHFLYLGRGFNYPVALEGALKLKEISYIHAEGYPAAEMKHGPIALIDEQMPVMVVAVKDAAYDKILSNIEEVRARQGRIVAVATEGDQEIACHSDRVLAVPESPGILTPILTVVPLQLLAYHVAVARGCDVDKPRNLAKSVTVE
ncbi:glutamine--fructose-6-phosphate transaminase (isomerizing), partial [Candidatus Fermentibacterales bacterium]|nr:glutamine--fructose-6-phosphate transaminase (isomerizing) [Candidatus Fermentibacterales bacterium]